MGLLGTAILGARSVCGFLWRREWGQLQYLTVASLRGLDLRRIRTDELGTSADVSVGFRDSGGPNLKTVLDTLGIASGDAVIDVGCGKGGALITMAKFPFRQLAGVEISRQLVDIARRNLAIMKVANCRVFCADASHFEDYDDFNLVYFYNPFYAPVMEQVIRNLEASIARRPRKVRILYYTPVCHKVIVNNSRFVLEKTFDHWDHPVNLYVHRGAAPSEPRTIGQSASIPSLSTSH